MYMNRVLIFATALLAVFIFACNVASPLEESDSPDGLNVELSGRDAHLTWRDRSESELAFVLERAKDSYFSEYDLTLIKLAENSISFSDNNLQPGDTYYYRVKSVNRQGDSSYSQVIRVKVPSLDELVPDVPIDLSADTISNSRILLSWKGGGERSEGFILERALDFSFEDFVKIELPKDIFSYNDSGLDSGTGYYYRVKALNEEGESGYSRIIRATTEPEPLRIPSRPTNLMIEIIADEKLELSWSDHSNHELGFLIEKANNSLFKGAERFFTDPNVTMFYDSELKAGRAYYYRVKALGEQLDSPFSEQVFIKLRLLDK